jgi:hypothetical protein
MSEFLANYTSTNRFGNRSTTNDRNLKSNFLPRGEWDKLTQDQRDKLIAKCRQERDASKSAQSPRQINLHDIIEYVRMKHDVVTEDISLY